MKNVYLLLLSLFVLSGCRPERGMDELSSANVPPNVQVFYNDKWDECSHCFEILLKVGDKRFSSEDDAAFSALLRELDFPNQRTLSAQHLANLHEYLLAVNRSIVTDVAATRARASLSADGRAAAHLPIIAYDDNGGATLTYWTVNENGMVEMVVGISAGHTVTKSNTVYINP